MAQTKYTYSISSDTLNAKANAGALKKEIEASSIVTALDYINSNDDVLDIYFKDALSFADETTLDTVVSDHAGAPIEPSTFMDLFPPDSIEKRLVATVDGLDTQTLDYTVTSGKVLRLYEVGGAAGASSCIQIIWDPAGANELIFVTHSATSERTLKTFTGNGSKVMRIKLFNNAISSQALSGYWIGHEQ